MSTNTRYTKQNEKHLESMSGQDCEHKRGSTHVHVWKPLCLILAVLFVTVPILVGVLVWYFHRMPQYMMINDDGVPVPTRSRGVCIRLDGVKFYEGQKFEIEDYKSTPKQCICENAFPTPRPPAINCREKGCRGDAVEFRKPGDMNRRNCTCVKGTDPNLADAYTLFHWRCPGDVVYCRHNFEPIVIGNKWVEAGQDCMCNPPVGIDQPQVTCSPTGCKSSTGAVASPGDMDHRGCTCIPAYVANRKAWLPHYWRCPPGTNHTCKLNNMKNPVSVGETWRITNWENIPHLCVCQKSLPGYPGQPPSVVCKLQGCFDKKGTFHGPRSVSGPCRCAPGTHSDHHEHVQLYHWNCTNA